MLIFDDINHFTMGVLAHNFTIIGFILCTKMLWLVGNVLLPFHFAERIKTMLKKLLSLLCLSFLISSPVFAEHHEGASDEASDEHHEEGDHHDEEHEGESH